MFGSLIAGGLGIADAIFGQDAAQSANAANLERYYQGLGLMNRFDIRSNQLMDNSYSLLEQSLAGIQQGFGGAMNALNDLGDQQYNRINQQGQQAGAQVQQNLQRRGLGGTSVADNAQLGVGRQVADQQADLTSRLASLRAGLLTQQAGMEASVLGQMSGVNFNRAGFESNQLGRRLDWIGGRQDVASGSLGGGIIGGLQSSGLGGELGSLLDGLFGGGG